VRPRSAQKVRPQGAPTRCAQGAPARSARKVRPVGAPTRCAQKVRPPRAPKERPHGAPQGTHSENAHEERQRNGPNRKPVK